MVDFVPVPFPVLLTRLFRELSAKKATYQLPRWKFVQGDPAVDLSVDLHGHCAATPFGPAAGPHTQLAQNILLGWLAGGRIIELKTVQILDRLEIARPCIDMANVGFNIEWSQELTLEQSLEEYVKAMMLIEIAKTEGLVTGLDDTVIDMSVGYDLAGISSPAVSAFLAGMADARPIIDRLRAEIPAEFARLRDLDYPTRISDSVTLSTFHGCPPEEIERIAAHLIDKAGLNVVVKLNPTLLGKDRLEGILADDLGFPELKVPKGTFAKDASWSQVVAFVDRLGKLADARGRSFGVKFTNTLLVENHRDVFPKAAREMYMSGPPLHVLAMTLVKEFRSVFGDRFPISFSAGIDAGNFADAVALGLKPVSVCTDLLKSGGYARGSTYIDALRARMRETGAVDIDGFVLKAFGAAAPALDKAGLPSPVADACLRALATGEDLRAAAGAHFDAWVSAAKILNTEHYVAHLTDNRHYAADGIDPAPVKSGEPLMEFDCETCGKCVPVCPNAALFRYPSPGERIVMDRAVPDKNGFQLERVRVIAVSMPQQIGLYADACNECGNCGTICPQSGLPSAVKPAFFGSLDSFERSAEREGYFVEKVDGNVRVLGRSGGMTTELILVPDGRLFFRGPGFDLVFSDQTEEAKITGHADGPVELGRMRLQLMLVRAVALRQDTVNFVSASLAASGT